MLHRLKTTFPRARYFAGAWLLVELISIPAAAHVAMNMGFQIQDPVIAERVGEEQAGTATFIVTHTQDFQLGVINAQGDVQVTVQHTTDPLTSAQRLESCKTVESQHPRILATVTKPENTEKAYATTIVSVTFEGATAPEIVMEPKMFAPESRDCGDHSA